MKNGHPDVLVLGGGVFGCAVCYSLARRGQRVTLLDAATPGRATSASAGGLWPVGESLGLGCGVIFHRSEGDGDSAGPDPLPRRFMEFLRESNRRFPELSERLREEGGVEIELESNTGLLYLVYDDSQERHARELLEWLGHDANLAEYWTPEQVCRRDPLVTRELRGAVHFPADHQVNPMLLAEAFKRAAVRHGARFRAEARVTGLKVEHSRVVEVETTAGRFQGGVVVNAAGAWAGKIARMAGLHLPVTPVRGQILCSEALQETLRCNLSTVDCYLLQKQHGEILVGSTTEDTGFDVDVRLEDLARLAAGALRAVPSLARATLKRTWSGLRPGTPDEFPILGPSGELDNLHHATGGFRTGIVSAPLSGELVAAGILGEAPAFPLEPFLAARFHRVSGPAAPLAGVRTGAGVAEPENEAG